MSQDFSRQSNQQIYQKGLKARLAAQELNVSEKSLQFRWGQFAFLSALGILLSSGFIFIAALPLRYTRLIFGRKAFWLTGFAASFGLAALQQWSWAAIYFSLITLIGVYREFEIKNQSVFRSALGAIIATASTSLLFLWSFSFFKNLTPAALIQTQVAAVTQQLSSFPQFKDSLNLENIIYYIPSGIIISLMLILFVSLTVSTDRKGLQNWMDLKSFSLPDSTVWIFIVALAGTFSLGDSPAALVSANILSVCLAAYFFQGLAVFSCFLDYVKVFGFWRMLAYFLIFFQMFIFISGLGILDFWFDFRLYFNNKMKEHRI